MSLVVVSSWCPNDVPSVLNHVCFCVPLPRRSLGRKGSTTGGSVSDPVHEFVSPRVPPIRPPNRPEEPGVSRRVSFPYFKTILLQTGLLPQGLKNGVKSLHSPLTLNPFSLTKRQLKGELNRKGKIKVSGVTVSKDNGISV